MPGAKRHEHTAKADRMAEHIEESAKREGRYKGREKEVAWASVHKEMPKRAAHRRSAGAVRSRSSTRHAKVAAPGRTRGSSGRG